EPVGTLFVPPAEAAAGTGKMTARHRWIGLTRRPRGKILIDDGAARAVRGRKSLLASGITAVEGRFEPGDVVAVVGPDGETVAQGLTNYASTDVERIKGLRSSRFREVLGDRPYDEVIHADNLVVTG
ncbi:MAG: PUA domain-containing protein, partial [Phycisphaerae bacterium]